MKRGSETAQCILCLHYFVPKSVCMLTGEYMNSLEIRDCMDWQLAPMDMVRPRLKWNMAYDEKNCVMVRQ